MVLCFVPFCSNRTEGLDKHSFHKFPTSDKRKRQWLRAMKRDKHGQYFLNQAKDELSIKSSTKICSAHFTPLDFIYNAKKKMLSNIAVPSIFKWTSNTDSINKEKPHNSRTKEPKAACFVPCDCCQIVIEENPEENDSEVEEIIIERQIDSDGVENHCFTKSQQEQTDDTEEISMDEKPEIAKIQITEENMATLLDLDIKEEFLDIPNETNSSYLAQSGYCADFVETGNDANYSNDVTACYTDLVSYNCDYTEEPTNDNNELTYYATANSSDFTEPLKTIKKNKLKQKVQPKSADNYTDFVTYNCDYTEKPTNDDNELTYYATANSSEITEPSKTIKKNKPRQKTHIKTETIENNISDSTTKSLHHIKAHIIHKEHVIAKCNFGSDNPSLTANPTLGIPIFTIERFKAHDESIEYYTGLPSYDLMQLIFTYVLPSSNADHVYYATKNVRLIRNYNLSGMNQFFMTVLKLKRNFDIKLISDLFSVSEAIVFSVFRAWIQYLHNRLSQLIRWPHRELLIKTQQNVIGGLYITKLIMEHESKKGLFMLDPNFNLIFVSKLFPDHLTVRQLMQQSYFLREITRKYEIKELRGTDIIITGDRMLEVRSFVKWKETDNIDILVVEVTDCKKNNLAMLTEERMNVKQIYDKLNIYSILRNYDSSLYDAHFFNEMYTVCMFLSFFKLNSSI